MKQFLVLIISIIIFSGSTISVANEDTFLISGEEHKSDTRVIKKKKKVKKEKPKKKYTSVRSTEQKEEVYEEVYDLNDLFSFSYSLGSYDYILTSSSQNIAFQSLAHVFFLQAKKKISNKFRAHGDIKFSAYNFNLPSGISITQLQGSRLGISLGSSYELIESKDELDHLNVYLGYYFLKNNADVTSPLQIPSSTAHMIELGLSGNWQWAKNLQLRYDLRGGYGLTYLETPLSSGNKDKHLQFRGLLTFDYQFYKEIFFSFTYQFDHSSVQFNNGGTRNLQNASITETQHSFGFQINFKY